MTSAQSRYAASLALATHRLIERTLNAGGVTQFTLSPIRIRQLADALEKDLRRIEDNQGAGIALTKVVGYWAFWIRKTRPVIIAYEGIAPASGEPNLFSEIADINERVALEFAVSALSSQSREGGVIHDPFRSECKASSCDGRACMRAYARYTLNIHDNVFEKYLLYSMRFRTFGPHHFVMLLDQMLISACFGQQPERPQGSHSQLV